MEFIKKTIQQVMTTGTTTGCTGGTCFVIIPNTGVTYNFMICLSQEATDIGFFDALITPYGYYGTLLGDEPEGYYDNLIFGIGETLLMDDLYI